MKRTTLFFLIILLNSNLQAQDILKSWNIDIGLFSKGENNSIVDVPGVSVGHHTLIIGDSIRTGVTAILPHQSNLFQSKVPAAIHVSNGFGKLAGSTQVRELGNIESPIILTNTLSVSAGIQGGLEYTLSQKGNGKVRSANIVVGETNDSKLNDIRGFHVKPSHVLAAIENATATNLQQGNVGAGTGTSVFGFKGGIGTSSRKLPSSLGGYTIGVIVQSNFGGNLEIAGVPIAKQWGRYPFKNQILNPDGSCMIVVATDAPILARNLNRLAKRAMLGFGKTGGMSSNGSGDYVIAFSTSESVRYLYQTDSPLTQGQELRNNEISPLFQAVIEATEEAIINSMLHAEDMIGKGNYKVTAIDHEKLKKALGVEK